MLTKNDLQQIRGVVREEVKIQVDEGLTRELTPIKKDIKTLKKDMKKVKKDVSTLIDHFDKRGVHLQKRVARIEDHLSLPPIQI